MTKMVREPALLHPTPKVMLRLLMLPLQMQQRLRPKRPRFDLCAMQ
jgi:hypothetical protein